jgi:hypothetical protein
VIKKLKVFQCNRYAGPNSGGQQLKTSFEWMSLLTEADIHLSRVFECLNLETIEPASVSSRTREEPIVMNELKTFSKTKKKIPSSLHETFVFWGGVQNSL